MSWTYLFCRASQYISSLLSKHIPKVAVTKAVAGELEIGNLKMSSAVFNALQTLAVESADVVYDQL